MQWHIVKNTLFHIAFSANLPVWVRGVVPSWHTTSEQRCYDVVLVFWHRFNVPYNVVPYVTACASWVGFAKLTLNPIFYAKYWFVSHFISHYWLTPPLGINVWQGYFIPEILILMDRGWGSLNWWEYKYIVQTSQFMPIIVDFLTYLLISYTQVLPLMRKDIVLPLCLRCEEMNRFFFVAFYWHSRGKTMSTVHIDTDENLLCVITGHKKVYPEYLDEHLWRRVKRQSSCSLSRRIVTFLLSYTYVFF